MTGTEVASITGTELAGANDYVITEEVAERLASAMPANTRRAYDRQWLAFTAWCSQSGRTPLPATAQTVLSYVTHLCDAGKSPATIDQALAVVLFHHRPLGVKPDTTPARAVLRDHKRRWSDERGRMKQKEAAPVDLARLRRMLGKCDLETTRGRRDRVILLLGFSLFARRSELASLRIDDVEFTEKGMRVLIRASKTDQAGEGVDIFIPTGRRASTCPVRAVQDWIACLAEQGVTTGPLLRAVDRNGKVRGGVTGQGVEYVIKGLADEVGISGVSGHSLRAGAATQAAKNGHAASEIARKGRWTSTKTVEDKYVRPITDEDEESMLGL
jgi:integrase